MEQKGTVHFCLKAWGYLNDSNPDLSGTGFGNSIIGYRVIKTGYLITDHRLPDYLAFHLGK
ncbi:MAG: hypothetical protein AB1567_07375 [bacterium]